ncbi:hypothetical protein OSB04_023202 [Centaurea solstitialis]|uniref:Uncharacterized protein n=1 Tax=Centaurea solstitialis TaxID=347529 RepID=A0AA38SIR0_9ASTR|nr:hypothetical protein OSB04_023202 [Centaurea solstitialis]
MGPLFVLLRKTRGGSSISFWEDRWVINGRLKKRFNRLFQLEVNKGVSVAKRGEDWGWRCESRGREIGELEDLMRVVEGVMPKKGCGDRVTWNSDPNKEKHIAKGDNGITTTWSTSVQKKICIFIWRATIVMLPSRSELDKWGSAIDHALFNCEEVKKVWNLIGRWWNLHLDSVSPSVEIDKVGVRGNGSDKGLKRWKEVMFDSETRRDKELAVDWANMVVGYV